MLAHRRALLTGSAAALAFSGLARHAAAQTAATGETYVNEVEGCCNPDRYRQCFSAANWQRLGKLRQQYDPAGVFHSYLGHS